MSIVGAQGVSMSELTGMGLDRLNAMAQGQQPSIAPSYLVLAAIEQLKKGKAGEQTPMPQGTVKDRLLASINQPPPMQAGIAQMAHPQQPQQAAQPTQHMSGGGQVQHFAEGGKPLSGGEAIAKWMSEFGGEVVDDIRNIGRGKYRRRTEEEMNYGNEALRGATQATSPTSDPAAARVGTEVGRATNLNGPLKGAPPVDPTSTAASISSSARSRGVGSTGMSPLEKYDHSIDATPSAASFQLNIPKNQQLADAAAKYSSPDAKRMAELERAEERAGLGAFARGMVNPDKGRGFGAVFGSAAADWNDAREKRADARREYEDKRQEMATKLSVMQGEEARDNFLKNSEFGAKRAQEAWEQAAKGTELRIQGTHYRNQDLLKAREIEAHLEGIKEQAASRKDNNLLQRVTMISQQRVAAAEKARSDVYAKYKQMPTFGIDQTLQRKADFEAETAARNADAKYLVSLAPMLKQLGVPTE